MAVFTTKLSYTQLFNWGLSRIQQHNSVCLRLDRSRQQGIILILSSFETPCMPGWSLFAVNLKRGKSDEISWKYLHKKIALSFATWISNGLNLDTTRQLAVYKDGIFESKCFVKHPVCLWGGVWYGSLVACSDRMTRSVVLTTSDDDGRRLSDVVGPLPPRLSTWGSCAEL